jgi:hypothetical protein
MATTLRIEMRCQAAVSTTGNRPIRRAEREHTQGALLQQASRAPRRSEIASATLWSAVRLCLTYIVRAQVLFRFEVRITVIAVERSDQALDRIAYSLEQPGMCPMRVALNELVGSHGIEGVHQMGLGTTSREPWRQ